jgi:(p)ppGpp synthase/HD superfamily hydrolase
MKYGRRFEAALVFASQLHRDQFRKGTEIPYVTHLLAVASLVGETGGSEDEVIAALLHDAVEDQGGEPTLQKIREQFGDNVANIVHECSDTDTFPKPPWRERREAYLVHLKYVTPSVLLVSCADKLHNARSLVADFHEIGNQLWERFNASRDDIIWYYESLVEVFDKSGLHMRLVLELHRTVQTLKERIASAA